MSVFLETAARLDWPAEALRITVARLGGLQREIAQDFVSDLLTHCAVKLPPQCVSEADYRAYFFASLRNRLNDAAAGKPYAIGHLSACAEPLEDRPRLDLADAPELTPPDAYTFVGPMLQAAAGNFSAMQMVLLTAYLRDGEKLAPLAGAAGVTCEVAKKWVSKFRKWAKDHFGTAYEAFKAEGSE